MSEVAFAVAAHPDDIEFMMAGTLLLLGDAGYELHYMNVANGSCGSLTTNRDETVAIRTQESKDAAAKLGATYHDPLVDDLQIYYTPELVAKLCAIVREVNPQILLIPSPQDYMEDHMNVSRLMVTATFCRIAPNFPTDPPTDHVEREVALYHCMPAGLEDQLRNPIYADLYLDISSEIDQKRQALACHRSQKEWLDATQGMDSYLKTMEDLSYRMGKMSGKFEYAEGWRKHLHLGFGSEDFDPLSDALENKIIFKDNNGEN